MKHGSLSLTLPALEAEVAEAASLQIPFVSTKLNVERGFVLGIVGGSEGNVAFRTGTGSAGLLLSESRGD